MTPDPSDWNLTDEEVDADNEVDARVWDAHAAEHLPARGYNPDGSRMQQPPSQRPEQHEEYGEFSPEEEAALDKVWEQERILNQAEWEKSRSRDSSGARAPKQPDPTPKRPAAVKRPRSPKRSK